MSDHRSRSLRHALKQAALTGTTGSLLLGAAVAGLVAPASTAAAVAAPASAGTLQLAEPASRAASGATTGATVTLHAATVAATTHRRLDVNRMMRTAASLKGRPYRYGAAGPWAFDCSGYVQYVLKQQGIRMNRSAAAQYAQTRHIAKKYARPGDLVFFYGSGGIYHVGIYAGHGMMWAAPHTGAVVRLQKIWGSNWVIGRL